MTTEQAEETLLKLARWFKTPIPDFKWLEGHQRIHGSCGVNSIALERESYVPHLDTLAHEFAHLLAGHRWRFEVYMKATRRYEAWPTRPFKRSEPPHGREFFDCLVEVVEFLYPNPNDYGWDEEGDRIVQWWNKYKRAA